MGADILVVPSCHLPKGILSLAAGALCRAGIIIKQYVTKLNSAGSH
jgi:hypothetical protein